MLQSTLILPYTLLPRPYQSSHREAVVHVLGAGLCNTGVRQVHLVEDQGLWRKQDDVVQLQYIMCIITVLNHLIMRLNLDLFLISYFYSRSKAHDED